MAPVTSVVSTNRLFSTEYPVTRSAFLWCGGSAAAATGTCDSSSPNVKYLAAADEEDLNVHKEGQTC